jgi:hypothetical protein
MQVSRDVSLRKYQKEIERLRAQMETLNARGVFVEGESVYPYVNVWFIPRHALQLLATPTGPLPPNVPPNAVVVLEIPSLAARAFKVRFDLSDYDQAPPSVEFRDPWTNELLKYEEMFRAHEYEKGRGPHVVLLDVHPKTGKPFLCIRGVREYHEHPQHSGDEWLIYRNHMNLFSLVLAIWRVGVDLIRPIVAPGPGGLQIQWVAQEKS